MRPGLKVLYASGYTKNAIVHHGRLDPGVQLLSKPYRRHELAQKLRSVLKSDWHGLTRRYFHNHHHLISKAVMTW